ncbi:MAG: UbiA-like polyprenyltransferase [Syntrophomonadaceae bacterium]|jgi:4-hydroxybenzoate polyprenyltransferase
MALNKIKLFLQMVDIEHSLFGLPFAYLGAFLGARGIPTLEQLFWITVAMVSARTAALCLNRLIDRKIDQANPRTAHWIMASGKLPTGPIWASVIVCFIILFIAATQLNLLCLMLAPLAVIILWIYSYTKRFTWLSHLFLGVAIGMGPVGGWIGVTGSFDWQPLILGAAVAFWIAGFDTMYACQDIAFDRQNKLFSIPARFGERGALFFSAGFHLLTVLCLIANGLVNKLGNWYFSGVGFISILLLYEHVIVRPGNLRKVTLASFKINHYVGLIVFITALFDLLK